MPAMPLYKRGLLTMLVSLTFSKLYVMYKRMVMWLLCIICIGCQQDLDIVDEQYLAYRGGQSWERDRGCFLIDLIDCQHQRQEPEFVDTWGYELR